MLAIWLMKTVVCTYRVRPGAQEQFETLLTRHWLTLHALGFVTDNRPQVLRHTEEPTYVEIFTWVVGGFGLAHEHPERTGDLGTNGPSPRGTKRSP
jgi:hypothetical protein